MAPPGRLGIFVPDPSTSQRGEPADRSGELERSRYRSLNGWPWGDVTVADIAQMLTEAGEALVITDGADVFVNSRLSAVTGRSSDDLARDRELRRLVSNAERRFHASLRKPDGSALPVAVETVRVRLLPARTAVLALVRPADTLPAEGEPSLVRQALRHVIHEAAASPHRRQKIGRGLALISPGSSMEDHLRAYAAMGLGTLTETARDAGNITFHASDTIERSYHATTVTCDMTLGFLLGAAEQVWPFEQFLGTEMTCASRGDADCTFRLRGMTEAGGPAVLG